MKNHFNINKLLIVVFSFICFFMVSYGVKAFDKSDLNGAFAEYNNFNCNQNYTKQCKYIQAANVPGFTQAELANLSYFTINIGSSGICITATFDNVTAPVENPIAYFTADDLNGKCPNVLYVNRHGNSTSFITHGMDGNDLWTKYGKVVSFDDSDTETISTDEVIKNSELLKFIKSVYNIIRFLVPVLIIVFSTIDFVGVVISGENEKMEKAKKKFALRIIIGIVFIFVPIILEILLKLAGILKSDESLANVVYNIIN